jgi:hypothetical protein
MKIDTLAKRQKIKTKTIIIDKIVYGAPALPKISVRPINPTYKEMKMAKVLEQYISYEFDENKDFITACTSAKDSIDRLFNISTPNFIWERVIEAGFRLRVETIKKSPYASGSPKKGTTLKRELEKLK